MIVDGDELKTDSKFGLYASNQQWCELLGTPGAADVTDESRTDACEIATAADGRRTAMFEHVVW